MSAALENVPRGGEDLAEVTSLEGAVRAWLVLDAGHRGGAVLTPERPVMLDGTAMDEFTGEGIAALVERLPGSRRRRLTLPTTPREIATAAGGR